MRILPLLALSLAFVACATDEPAEAMPESDSVEPATDVLAAEIAPVNLNTATDDEFKTIPGVGDRMAHEFDEYRPYASIREFRAEIGKYVDEDQVAEYEQFVFVPIDPNASDDATLEQLPGIDAEAAGALIDARPFESADAFLAAYADLVAGADVDAARVLLAE